MKGEPIDPGTEEETLTPYIDDGTEDIRTTGIIVLKDTRGGMAALHRDGAITGTPFPSELRLTDLGSTILDTDPASSSSRRIHRPILASWSMETVLSAGFSEGWKWAGRADLSLLEGLQNPPSLYIRFPEGPTVRMPVC